MWRSWVEQTRWVQGQVANVGSGNQDGTVMVVRKRPSSSYAQANIPWSSEMCAPRAQAAERPPSGPRAAHGRPTGGPRAPPVGSRLPARENQGRKAVTRIVDRKSRVHVAPDDCPLYVQQARPGRRHGGGGGTNGGAGVLS